MAHFEFMYSTLYLFLLSLFEPYTPQQGERYEECLYDVEFTAYLLSAAFS